MTEAARDDLVVLPPVADDPVFVDDAGEPTTEARPLSHDPHEFAALYMRHRWSFALHAGRFLHDKRDVDEVVQEGFLKLFLALPELENELQALAYARRTITNLCIDRYRADQRRPRLVDLESITPGELADDEELDPIVAAEDAAIVREALAMLSPLHREALIKREVEEKSLPVIAEELDIPVEQVKHVLHRARRSLRRLLVGTHVEPGVDLDLAAVLAANRARAASAAKPTGAAALALILVLAGVLGLRSRQGDEAVMGALPRTPAGGLLDPSPQHGASDAPAAAPSVPAVAKPTASKPATKPRAGTTTAGPSTATAAPVVVTPTSAPAPAQPPAVAPPVTPARPATDRSRLSLAGLLSSTAKPAIESVETFEHSTGTSAAFSRFVASTEQGPLVLAQTLTSDATAAVYNADVALPVGGTAVPVTLGTPDQPVQAPTVTTHPDGTVEVVLDTVFTLPAGATGELPVTDRFVVQALYDADLTTVLAEKVVVGGPSDPLPALVAAPADHSSAPAPDGSTVRPEPTSKNLSSGRENPAGRDQEPLPSS